MIEFTFEDHLYHVVRSVDEPLSVTNVAEEWLWFIEENGIKVNTLSVEAYTRAILKCSGYIIGV